MAPTTNNVKIIFGGAAFNTNYGSTADKVSEVLAWLEKEGIKTIDTSEVYGDSEELLGAANAAGKGFIIDTKIGGGLAGVKSSGERVVKAAAESLRKLNTDSVRPPPGPFFFSFRYGPSIDGSTGRCLFHPHPRQTRPT